MLEAIDLRKVYNGKVALEQLNLRIEKGEIFCLLGANGAGKSTTIQSFLGFVTPTSGSAFIGGVEVSTNIQQIRKQLAYIPENVMLYPHLTALQNLAYFSGLAGKNYTFAELHQFLSQAGLQTDAHAKSIDTYSKGMRQKAGIAIALAKQARYLFLDEPTSGLDPLASNEFSTLIRNLADSGVTILMATHDLFRAKEVGDRIGILKDGKLVCALHASDVSHTQLENTYLEAIRPRQVV